MWVNKIAGRGSTRKEKGSGSAPVCVSRMLRMKLGRNEISYSDGTGRGFRRNRTLSRGWAGGRGGGPPGGNKVNLRDASIAECAISPRLGESFVALALPILAARRYFQVPYRGDFPDSCGNGFPAAPPNHPNHPPTPH